MAEGPKEAGEKLQNVDLKRKCPDSSPTQSEKKPKLESPKVQRLISKLSTVREVWKQEKAGQPRTRSAWLPTIENEGSAQAASLPASPHLSPLKDSQLPRKPLACLECPAKDTQIQTILQRIEDVSVTLSERDVRIRQLKDTITQAEEYRRYLHSQVVELKGPIRVMCRLKPLDSGASSCVYLPEIGLGERCAHSVAWGSGTHKSTYLFDRVFGAQASQEEVFEEVKAYVQSAIDGDQVCLFTYGQTGSGKTYTLEGPSFTGAVTSQSGIVPRTAIYLFDEISRQGGVDYSVHVSCLEIYNEALYDLFTDSNAKLSIKTVRNKVLIDPLTCVPVASSSALLTALASAIQRRSTRDTHLNVSSSRSHCLYSFTFQGTNASGQTIAGKLNIIDLAGSERANVDTFEGKSLREVADMKAVQSEAKFINISLSCLRRVVSSLIAIRARGSGLLPPFRESKLTRILQDSLLAPAAKVLVIVNVCSGTETAAETRESLKFGSDAQFCQF